MKIAGAVNDKNDFRELSMWANGGYVFLYYFRYLLIIILMKGSCCTLFFMGLLLTFVSELSILLSIALTGGLSDYYYVISFHLIFFTNSHAFLIISMQ